jgi:hypothetical protein
VPFNCEKLGGFGFSLKRRTLRVGVYVDAFNLYYGARNQCGRSTTGWRWLDIESLARHLLDDNLTWAKVSIEKIVYCTALREKPSDPSSASDQATYLSALSANSKVQILHGMYRVRHGKGMLVEPKGSKGRQVQPVHAAKVLGLMPDFPGAPILDEEGNWALAVHYRSFEEKGSDVNLASQLLIDVLSGHFDAAIVISNDGDLAFPLKIARARIKIGLVNPNNSNTSAMLMGSAADGVGGHWWKRLTAAEYFANQLPDDVQGNQKPFEW